MSFSDIVLEHAKWKVQLRSSIEMGVSNIASDALMDSNAWPLSHWLSKNEPYLGHLKDFCDFKRDYEAFHLCVADMMICLEQGHKDKAQELVRSEMFALIADSTAESMRKLQKHLG